MKTTGVAKAKATVREGTHTVIVYASLPEEVVAYVVPDSEISEQQFKFLQEANNKLVNLDESNAGMQFLCDAFSPKAEYCSEECRPEYRCVWAKYKHDFADGPILAAVSNVYYSGFVL